jgi:hypothetical protein
MRPDKRRRLAEVFAIGILVACGGTDAGEACDLQAPCPANPAAVIVSVTSSTTGASIPGAYLKLTSSASSLIPCDRGPGSTCNVSGDAGTYEFDVAAPGFQAVHQRVVVEANKGCPCDIVVTQHVAVALVPIP